MTRLDMQSVTGDSSQDHFYKISEPLMDTTNLFAHKKCVFFA